MHLLIAMFITVVPFKKILELDKLLKNIKGRENERVGSRGVE